MSKSKAQEWVDLINGPEPIYLPHTHIKVEVKRAGKHAVMILSDWETKKQSVELYPEAALALADWIYANFQSEEPQ